MSRLSAVIRRRRKLFVLAWVALLVVSIPFASRQTENLTGGGFEVPGTGSAVVDAEVSRFQGANSEPLGIVLERRGGDGESMQAAVARVREAADEVEHVALAPEAEQAAAGAAAQDPVLLLPLVTTGSRDETLEAAVDLREELGAGEVEDGVQPYVVGQQALWAGMQELQREDLEKAEIMGFPVILVVLLAVFGSFVAASLPLLLGVAAVIVTGGVVFFLALATTMSVFVTNIASMLGIGVAVDYSLFLLSRYREELAEGRSREEALDTAMQTSGATVVFSGVTVIVSLAGLFLLDSAIMRSLAIGAIVVVAIAILGAVTLLPALIALFGRRTSEPGRVVSATGTLVRRIARRPRKPAGGSTFWPAWTARLMRRPVVFAAGGTALLLVLAVPALSLQFGDGALRMFPEDHETRRGAELAGGLSTPGAASPLLVVAQFEEGDASTLSNRAALERYASGVREIEGVAEVAAPQASEDGTAALVRVIAATDPESDATLALVDRLRADGGRAAGLSEVADVDVGGASAQLRDFSGLISGDLWKVFAFVLICSYLVLLVVLRSVLLPLKAVMMNLLSIGAAYGILVAVFQYGWLDGITGFESLGYINAITPPLLLAIVFGLSMDYEVFLLSRIRERYEATGDNRQAVSEGLAASAKVITSAAVIMVAVFGTFALTGVPQIKEIGVGLSVAIALDATIVRLVLVPATMDLMGAWNWWLPAWLDRILPHADFERAPEREEDRATAAA